MAGRFVAVVGRKGGCGKSSECILLGGEAIVKGMKVVVLDGNGTEGTLTSTAAQEGALLMKSLVQDGSPETGGIDELFARVEAFRQVVDLVILDTPPAGDQISKVTIEAIKKADSLVLPFGSDMEELVSQEELYEDLIKPLIADRPNVTVFIAPNRVETGRLASKIAKRVKEGIFSEVTKLPDFLNCRPFKEAKSLGLTLHEFPHRPTSTLARLSEAASEALAMIVADK